ncbi:hypothetical protein ACIBI4_06210 [Streptomyces sp. NPDC050418]|uniref:hypothetical protein n=1 Tax=Streptomyces sp. NPDC050418 TaxID=3365612 RepID=UPI0037B280F2
MQRLPDGMVRLGTDHRGQAVYGYPVAQTVAPQRPIVARPWAAWLVIGSFAAVIALFLLIGLAILAAVLALVAVCLTICVVVLRSLLRDLRKEK